MAACEPVEHGVEGGGQLADLVVGALVTQTAVEIAVLDGRCRGGDPADVAQQAAQQEVGAGHRADQGHERLPDQ